MRGTVLGAVLVLAGLAVTLPAAAGSGEPLVILASPALKTPLVALAEAFEASHPHVHIKILLDSAMALRGTIGRLQKSGRYGPGSGLVHIVAPADQELLDRLEHRYYVLPETRRAYATDRLVLVVPAGADVSTVSLTDLAQDRTRRLVVADPEVTELGHRTDLMLNRFPWPVETRSRVIVAQDAHGVLDRLAHGIGEAGIVFEHQAIQAGAPVKVAGLVGPEVSPPLVYAMAMERFCPNRPLCQEFLEFSQSRQAETILAPLGYGPPPRGDQAHSASTGAPTESGASRSGPAILDWLGSWGRRQE